MAKVTVYPSTRWQMAVGTQPEGNVPSPKLCTRAYYELPMHSQQVPDYSRGTDVDDSLLDGDGCVLISKLPK